jgi:hypothetical protein
VAELMARDGRENGEYSKREQPTRKAGWAASFHGGDQFLALVARPSADGKPNR